MLYFPNKSLARLYIQSSDSSSVKTHQLYFMGVLLRGGFSLHDDIISSLIYLTLISPTHPLFSLLNTPYLLVTLLEQTDN